MYVECFHNESSTITPIYFGKMAEKFDQLGRDYWNLLEGTRKQLENIEAMIGKVGTIRRCVFAGMISHWLGLIFGQPPEQSVVV